jgi:hypothetical protein
LGVSHLKEDRMDDEFDIVYEVDDGYVCGFRPQYINIDDVYLEDDMDEYQLNELYDEIVEEDFRQNISAYGQNRERFIEWAKNTINKRKEYEDSFNE